MSEFQSHYKRMLIEPPTLTQGQFAKVVGALSSHGLATYSEVTSMSIGEIKSLLDYCAWRNQQDKA